MPGLVPDTVTQMLLSLQKLVEQVPQLTTEVDVLVEAVHAKRLTLQALQAELAAFDSQLELLGEVAGPVADVERSVVPVAWVAERCPRVGRTEGFAGGLSNAHAVDVVHHRVGPLTSRRSAPSSSCTRAPRLESHLHARRAASLPGLQRRPRLRPEKG